MSKYYNPNFGQGPLGQAARAARAAGRFGDTELIHLNSAELRHLEDMWGAPTVNPHTGLPEFFSWGDALAIAAPLAADTYTNWGSDLGSAIGLSGDTARQVGDSLVGSGLGALAGGLTHNGWGRGALTGATMGALGGGAGSSIGSLLSNDPRTAQLIGNSLLGAGAGASTGVGPLAGALGAAAATKLAPGVQASLSGTPLGNLIGISTAGPAVAPQGGTSPTAGGAVSGTTSLGIGAQGSPDQVNPTTQAVSQLGAQTASNTEGLPALLKKYWPVLLMALQAGALKNTRAQTAHAPALPASMTTPLPSITSPPRTVSPYAGNYYTYGENPEHAFFNNNEVPTTSSGHATGGTIHSAAGPTGGALSQAGQYVKGHGTGRSDDIDAKLSDGEYVMDAETVSMLGDGSSDAGAAKLNRLRQNIRKHKSKGLAKGKMSPDAKEPEQYLGEV